MSISHRTVFFDDSTGVVRFSDWALVKTTLGTMVEVFNINQRNVTSVQLRDFDPTDEIARIDSIKRISLHREKLILSGGTQVLHGGIAQPRDGV